VGVSDPHEFIAAESQRIPFKAALSRPSLWQDAFKNWPLPPRLILHEFLKPREEIKENMQARRVFEYECSPTLYTWPFTPITIAHPTFNSWWQEFHDHIFSEPVHSFFLELMPDFQPTSEVI
jgi:hypothetical protein